ncbi:MAG: methyl-accepting chemotaxis protein [Gammaproteobacteria bacterium]
MLAYICWALIASFRWSVGGLNWLSDELAKGNLTVYLRDDAIDELEVAGKTLSGARENLRQMLKQVIGLIVPLKTATEQVVQVMQNHRGCWSAAVRNRTGGHRHERNGEHRTGNCQELDLGGQCGTEC